MQILPASGVVDVVRAESARFRHPLLLVHGLWTGSWIWSSFAGYLAHRGWESWAPSFLDGDWTGDPADRRHQLLEVCRALPAPPVLLAHDAGVMTVAKIAAEIGAPAIVVIAPLLPGAIGGYSAIFAQPQFWPARLFARRVAPPRGRAARTLLAGLTDGASRLRPDSGPFLRALLSGTERLPDAMPGPGLLICSRDDPMTSLIEAEALANRSDWSLDLHGIPGHFPMLAPGWEELADRVHSWLVRTLGEKLLALVDQEWGD